MIAWKGSLLNQAGREVLVKSILAVVPTYAIAYYKLPSTFCDSANKIIKDIWQGKSKERRQLHWLR